MKYPKVSDNFWLDEYFPISYIEMMGIRHCERMLDPQLVIGDQFLRSRFGAITINNQEGYSYSGVRPLEYIKARIIDGTLYPGLPKSLDSMHVFGKASDKKFSNVEIDEIYEDAKKNESLYLYHNIMRIENPVHTRGVNKDWLHTDTFYKAPFVSAGFVIKEPSLLVVNPDGTFFPINNNQ